ncbi:MAG: MerR family DNA-binding transcriptional regulator [Coriobacteriales bacterium]
MKELMTTGEFAALCETTKETLRHYERIGLLEPAARMPNGYKVYGFFQFTEYALIAALRSAGLSLEQIKDFRSTSSEEAMRVVLAERIEAIERERRELARCQATLELSLAAAEASGRWEDVGTPVHPGSAFPRWRVGECPQMRYIRTPLPSAEESAEAFLAAASEHSEYLGQLGLSSAWQGTYCIDGALFAQGRYAEALSLCTLLPDAAASGEVLRSPRLMLRPKGRYLMMLDEISLGDMRAFDAPNLLFRAYDSFLELARREGMRLKGDAFNTELSLYTGSATQPLRMELAMMVDED